MGRSSSLNQVAVMIFMVIVVAIIFMVGLWAVDIGASAMNLGIQYVQNFFGFTPSNELYHAGLVLSTVAFMVLAVAVVTVLFSWLRRGFKRI